MNDDDPIFERANQLFAAGQVIDTAQRPQGAIGTAEIYRSLTEPSQPITDQISRALFTSPALRAVFKSVQRRVGISEMPAMAAASDRTLSARTFEGGEARLTPARKGTQVYLTMQMDPSLPREPLLLILISDAGNRLAKRLLPAADDMGELLVVLDRQNAEDALFLAAFEDPQSEGSFMRAAPAEE
ncbi:MAG: hypothetical protein NXH88_01640 [Hyphomonas sp.]|nr:hypothetical protein [Hyphomonas sp.]